MNPYPPSAPSMRQILASLIALLVGVALLMTGNGLFNTFIGLRSSLEGLSNEAVGLMMSAYYVGLIIGTLQCGRLINRIGHIRALTAFTAMASAAMLAFPLLPHAWAWALLRAAIGFNMAGAFIVIESWLNDRATGSTRGTVLSLYMMISYLATGGGQWLINVGDPGGLDLFLITALLFSLALVPVAVTRATTPKPIGHTRMRVRQLYQTSPLATLGCLCTGLSSGAIYGVGPLFGKELGLPLSDISTFMATIVLCGLLLQWPIGYLSDRYDRRKVLTWVTLIVAVISLGQVGLMHYLAATLIHPGGVAAATWSDRLPILLVVAGLYGGFAFTIYPLSVAYANDYTDPADMVQTTGGLLLAFGIGAAAGPLLGGAAMSAMGPSGLFAYTGAVAVLLLVFALYRMRRRTWAPVQPKEAFVVLPDATATALPSELDPRPDVMQLSLDFGEVRDQSA